LSKQDDKLFVTNAVQQMANSYGEQRIKLVNFTLHIRKISSAQFEAEYW